MLCYYYFKRIINSFLIFIPLFITLLIGCTTSSSKEIKTLASFEHKMPTEIAKRIPLPINTSLTAQIEEEKRYSVMYKPKLTYLEMIDFISMNFPKYKWEITNEIIEEGEGERQSSWDITSEDYTGKLTLSAIVSEGDAKVNGMIIITEN